MTSTAVMTCAALSLAAIIATPAFTSNFVAFSMANTYCEKRELGMPMKDALQYAFDRVSSNELYEKDWLLPNFSTVWANEIARLCPYYTNH